MKKVSFDFDNTLSRRYVQEYAKNLVELGYEVWIVTLRFENPDDDILYGKDYNNNDLYDVANLLGIKKEHIVFTGLINKGKFFSENIDFVFHLDDSFAQIEDITNKCCKVKPVWLVNQHLKDSTSFDFCNKLLGI